MKSTTFSIKIFFCFCVVILFSVLVPCGYFLHSIKQESVDITRDEAFREAAFIRTYITESVAKGEFHQDGVLPETLKNFYSSNEHRVTLIDAEGTVLYDSFADDVSKLENHRYHEEVALAFSNGKGSSVRHSSSLGTSFVYAAARVSIPGTAISVIRVAAPLSLVEEHAVARSRALMAGAVAALIFAVAFAAFMSMRFRRSLQLMISSVENLATPGSRSGRISLRTLPGDEFAPLAAAVNSMAQRMEVQVNHILAQKAQLDAVLNSIAEGVLVVDQEGCIRSVNATLVRLFPKAAHAEGLQPVEVIPSPELQKGIESLKHTVPEKPVQFEMDNMSGRKLQVLICPIVGESRLLLAVAVFHDITEMSALMEMRRDFVANVSHELRTPLTAIMGYAESLRRYVAEPRALHFLEVIDRNSQYMATMVKDLLQLSSIENGAIPMDIKPMPASMAIRGGMDLCRTSAEARKLEFCEKLDQGDFSINADAEYLTRVIRNLLENACRYAPEGSQIVISAEPDRESGMAVFRVADKGPGIPPELRVRVFERFYRVEKHRGGQVSTGLGLAICKHVVERHGGCISIEDGPGCIVRFTVPLA